MSSTIPLLPREQIYNRYCSNNTTTAPLDPRKHRNNAMRSVCVGEEVDVEVMQPSGAELRQKCAETGPLA
jgi:hypothetical protein